MPKLAAIDVGSNAIRFAVASVNGDNHLKRVHAAREAVRLGGDVFAKGEISDATADKLVRVFGHFARVIREHEIKFVKAVATSALREASNGEAICDRVLAKTGIQIVLIDGHEEARLIHLAVAEALDLHDKLALIVDIGGGSTELTVSRDAHLVATDSLRLGTVRLLQQTRERDPGEKDLLPLLAEGAAEAAKFLKQTAAGRTIDLVAGTGGNVETLGRLRVELLEAGSDRQVKISELADIIDRLSRLTVSQRVSRLRLRPDRADVILPAAMVLRMVLEKSGVDRITIPRVGLKDGLLLDLCGQVWVRRTFIAR